MDKADGVLVYDYALRITNDIEIHDTLADGVVMTLKELLSAVRCFICCSILLARCQFACLFGWLFLRIWQLFVWTQICRKPSIDPLSGDRPLNFCNQWWRESQSGAQAHMVDRLEWVRVWDDVQNINSGVMNDLMLFSWSSGDSLMSMLMSLVMLLVWSGSIMSTCLWIYHSKRAMSGYLCCKQGLVSSLWYSGVRVLVSLVIWWFSSKREAVCAFNETVDSFAGNWSVDDSFVRHLF